ncbi:universal stress protein UspA family nucleotide-binding protein [Gloeomargarita lithophora Alchichica-D10]|uniref:Universal stress protein UspA family nucleotide-binding protein n=1 Tax=Gloeomargarita lithophora Alchichica-D10 TaxID=1188229 RepID=A0A1J0ACT2_9CYAN|nr:universal stress protein [Gloeomargarita lithophora]APB33729.1 universal stress protein UspA family nucleotide-binding protein [Gloeomargarita lithophora Alchichica-D10]
MFKRLAIATDLQDGLQRLSHFLPALGAGGVEAVTFVHGVPYRDTGVRTREDTEALAQAEAKLTLPAETGGVQANCIIRSGKPAEVVVQVAREVGADLILVGTQQRNALAEKLLGSDSLNIMRKCEIPLMVIRPQLVQVLTAEELDLRCRHLFYHLLLPYRGRAESKLLLNSVLTQVQKSPTPQVVCCHLVWVVEDPIRRDFAPDPQEIQRAEQELQAVAAQLTPHIPQVYTHVRTGNPVEACLTLAQMLDISAVTLTEAHMTNLWDLSASLGGELLRRIPYPLILFSTPEK